MKKSAEQDYVDAQYNLAMMYYQGNGINKNIKTAKKLLEKAAQKNMQMYNMI